MTGILYFPGNGLRKRFHMTIGSTTRIDLLVSDSCHATYIEADDILSLYIFQRDYDEIA